LKRRCELGFEARHNDRKATLFSGSLFFLSRLSGGSVVKIEVHVGKNSGDVGKNVRHVGKIAIDVGIP
jgi:hypothetical protein